MSVLADKDVALELAGKAYLGWTAIRVERAIDTMVGSFELSLSAKDRTGAEDWPIADGAPCRVLLGSEVLITGYVDVIERMTAAEDRTVTVRGRDKAADLVDCSAMNTPGSWSGQRLETIARALAKPFGVSIEITGDTGAPFKRFALQQGESVFAAIERMGRYRGLVTYSPGDGTLRIGKADRGERTGRIEEGVNVKTATATRDVSGRFSQYTLKGQAAGDDRRHGKAVSQAKGEATDSAVSRYRPLLVIGEEQSDAASLAKRAKWEAAVRAGRGQPLSVTVPGWLTDQGKAWAPGARAAVKIPTCRIDADMLVEGAALVRSADGTETQLRLVPPEAWSQLAEPEKS